jgi:hypothetical protein
MGRPHTKVNKTIRWGTGSDQVRTIPVELFTWEALDQVAAIRKAFKL